MLNRIDTTREGRNIKSIPLFINYFLKKSKYKKNKYRCIDSIRIGKTVRELLVDWFVTVVKASRKVISNTPFVLTRRVNGRLVRAQFQRDDNEF